jgi:hypothetical protein
MKHDHQRVHPAYIHGLRLIKQVRLVEICLQNPKILVLEKASWKQ